MPWFTALQLLRIVLDDQDGNSQNCSTSYIVKHISRRIITRYMESTICSRCDNQRAPNARYCYDCKAAYVREWRKSHPLNKEQQRRAEIRRLTRMAVLTRKIKKLPCESCGSPDSTCHHLTYDTHDNVRWLCRPCHLAEHGKRAVMPQEEYQARKDKRTPKITLCACGKPARSKEQRRCNECHAAAMRLHRSLHKPTAEQRRKANCRSYLFIYIKRGCIQKGPCIFCHTTENIEAYHEDYSKPLQVIWICRPHHVMVKMDLIKLPRKA